MKRDAVKWLLITYFQSIVILGSCSSSRDQRRIDSPDERMLVIINALGSSVNRPWTYLFNFFSTSTAISDHS